MILSWNVKYFDGEKAEAILGRVTINGNQFIICDRQLNQLDIWDLKTIEFDPHHLDYKFLMTKVEPHARIEMIEPTMMAHFAALKKSPLQKLLDSKQAIVIGGVTVLGFIVAIYFAAQPISRMIAKRIPFKYEEKLAQKLNYAEMFEICEPKQGPNNDEYQFIIKIKKMYPAAAEALGNLDKVKVIKMSQANAFALPGGQIFVTDTFINQAKSYEEIIGVLAHEKGHVNHRHHLQSLVRGGLLAGAASFVTGDFSSFVLMDPSSVMGIVNLKFNREDESEADRYAVDQVLKKVDVTSQGLIDFFERASTDQKELKGKIPNFLLTHPSDQSRISMLKKYAKDTTLIEVDPDDNINVLCN